MIKKLIFVRVDIVHIIASMISSSSEYFLSFYESNFVRIYKKPQCTSKYHTFNLLGCFVSHTWGLFKLVIYLIF